MDPAPILSVPAPSLVLLIGPAGSGKSTFCRRHFPATAVVSSDACRAAITGDAADQSATPAAFRLAHERVEARLRDRRLAVLDATNLQPSARRAALRLAERHHLPAVAIVLDLPPEECLRRDAGRRHRRVGPSVIRAHAAALRAAIPALQGEGFAVVHRLEGTAAGRARVVKEPLACDRRRETGPFDLIGDVHGCARELRLLMHRLGYRPTRGRGPLRHPRGRRAVFLGDLVDRGPHIVDAARLAMEMTEAGAALCLMGNHEEELTAALREAAAGGAPSPGTSLTFRQLRALPRRERRAFTERFTDFVAALPPHLLLDRARLVAAHAGIREEFIGRQSDEARRFALHGATTGALDRYGLPVRVHWAAAYAGRPFVVYGHTPVLRPERLGRTLNIDTGCVYGGALTALRWPERVLVSVPAASVYYRSPRTAALGIGIRAETRVLPPRT